MPKKQVQKVIGTHFNRNLILVFIQFAIIKRRHESEN